MMKLFSRQFWTIPSIGGLDSWSRFISWTRLLNTLRVCLMKYQNIKLPCLRNELSLRG